MKSDAFITFLHTHKNCRFFLSAAPGNSGDDLLQKGLVLYLESHNFLLTTDPTLADVILMHGGGSIDDVWGTGLDHFIQLLENHSDKILVVAPCTSHFTETDFAAVLKKYSQDIYLFAREKNTFLRFKQMFLPTNVHVTLATDTVFMLEGTEYLRQLKMVAKNKYILYAFRTNKESRITPIEWYPHKKGLVHILRRMYVQRKIKSFIRHNCPKTNQNDLIKIIDVAHSPYNLYVKQISDAHTIYTDRLHVGILGAMLGKQVHLYPTKYDKLQGVYEYTLHRYSNVTVHF